MIETSSENSDMRPLYFGSWSRFHDSSAGFTLSAR